jgi:ligand-binding sensor domain-containing protein
MGKLKRYLSIIALIALLLAAPGSIQDREEGCRAHTNANPMNGLAPDRGSGLTGDNTWITFDSTDGLVSNSVGNIAVDHAGRLWCGTGDGASVLDDNRTPFEEIDDDWTTFTTTHGLAYNAISAISVDGTKVVWFGHYDGYCGLSVLDHGGIPSEKIDDEWAACYAEYSADEVQFGYTEDIAVDEAGRLWFAAWALVGASVHGGAGVLDYAGTPVEGTDDSWTSFTYADGLAHPLVYAIAEDDPGWIWFGTLDGVSVLDHAGTPFDKADDTWTSFTVADGLADTRVYAIAVDSTGQLWFGTTDGVSVLDYGVTPFDKACDRWTTFTTADGLANNEVSAIAVDHVGRLWFGTYGDGVSVLNHGGTPFDKSDDKWTSFTSEDDLAGASVYAITVDDRWRAVNGRRRMWFGTDGGVSELIYEVHSTHLPIVMRPTWDVYYEDNDHWLDAYGPLASGQVYLAYPDDTDDYYHFVLSAPTTVDIRVEDFAPTSTYGDLVLYGPACSDERGEMIYHFGLRGYTTMLLGPHSLGPGKYYVRMYTAEQYSTDQLYRLTVTY